MILERPSGGRIFSPTAYVLVAAVFLVPLAALLPGPWHGGIDLASKDCQCPVCKIAGQGIVEAAATFQPAPPAPTSCLIHIELLSAEKDDGVHAHAARAPPNE